MFGTIAALFRFEPESPEQELARLHSEFMAGAKRDGLTDEQARHELAMRVSFVKLRRKVSALAAKQPRKFWDYRRDVAEAEGKILGAATTRKVGLEFVKFVLRQTPGELLLPDAHEACLRAWANDELPRAPINSDFLAALR